ncbi:MAG TPA: hypothetical protein VHM70_14635 [Polyangiaceae bacterium]|jgi:hypothetical protein|nr:hypothetical protein [Polyangiaceae bacterium]
MTPRHLLRLLALVSLPALYSCAEQRDPINRVQANALEKRFFVGDLEDTSDDPVFFSRNFVVDASKSQQLVSLSEASGLERLRWEITEDMLFARRAYSMTGGDNKGNGQDPNGDILAAYKIESHFDIRHAYNQSTGEELNVIEEIESDRPWYQREFFRVDWSENLVNSPSWSTMFFGTIFGDIKVTPTSYVNTDRNSDEAPHFEAADGYFDVTSHFFVEPAETQYFDWSVPMCLLMGVYTGSAIYSCDPQEAVLRTSYWRVDKADPDDDFEPLENTHAALDIVGNPGGMGESSSVGLLTPPREKYDPQYGYTDNGLRRYMNIHNLWQQSHQTRGQCTTDAECVSSTKRQGSVCLDSGTCSIPCNYEAAADVSPANGTDDQCENADTRYKGSEGSQCSARNRCTIPYRDRDTRVNSYFVNPEMPEALQDDVSSSGKVKRGAAEDLIYTWNQALQLAVAHAREVECRRTASNRSDLVQARADCHAKYFELADGKDVIQMVNDGGWGVETPKGSDKPLLVSCHNPVRDYDSEVCGAAGYQARVGDLRRNFMIYWPFDSEAPYGGIGNWRGDPLTGQIFGAAATTMGPSTTRAAAQTRDIALVALGLLNIDDITNGVPSAIFQKTLREGRSPKAMSGDEIKHRLESVDNHNLASSVSISLDDTTASDPREAIADIKASTITNAALEADQLLQVQAIAKPLLGTQFETQIVSPGWLVDATGLSPNTQLSDEILGIASPLQGQDMGRLASFDRSLFAKLGERGICTFDEMSSLGNPDLYGMGNYYAQKYPGLTRDEFAQKVYEDIWKETYKGIALHEIGHSLGLLHNFTSSYDSLNYDPQYWQLRTHDGASSADCEGQPRTGDTSQASADACMGPRYLDPETTDELGFADEPRPAIDYYAHTSTMEYQGSRFFETIGLGQYDVMAMGALYGRVLQTFDPSVIPVAQQAAFEFLNRSQLDESLSVIDTGVNGANVNGVHYTELARRAKLFDPSRCRKATAAEHAQAEWRIVHDKVCMPPPKDYGHWLDFIDTADPNLSRLQTIKAAKGRILGGLPVPASGNVRWPYRFGGDIVNSYLHVNPFDVGADPYEVTMETIAQNQYSYPFNYFRRERRGWTDMRLPSNTARLFYERLRSYHWGISFTNSLYNEITARLPVLSSEIDSWRQDDNELRPFLIAESEMFDAIAATFLLPEPGDYGPTDQQTGVHDLLAIGQGSNDKVFGLDAYGGRFISPSFDSGPTGGGSWQYQDYVNRAGFSVEKTMASRALTDGRAVFYSSGRQFYLDRRNLNINFRSDFPQGVDRLLGGVLAEDWTNISPYVTNAQNPVVVSRDIAGPSPNAPPTNSQPVFPNLGYNQQIPTIIFAQLFGRANGDLALSNKLRIWLEGSISGELDIPEAEQERFSDPLSGITYVARRFGPETLDGKEVEQGIGSRMLEHANALLAAAYVVDAEAGLDEFGRPTLTLDEDGNPIESDSFDLTGPSLRRYVGLLDANVQISTLLGHGPFNF